MSVLTKIADWFAPRADAVASVDHTERLVADRVDGWFSALTGYGIENKDKRVSARFQSDLLDDNTLMDLWRGDDLAAKIVEAIPNEAMRNGFTVNVGDKEKTESLMSVLEELNAAEMVRYAKKLERAYGGAAIFPVINDGTGDLASPLVEDRIAKITHLQTFEPRELQPFRYYDDPLMPKFGEPSTYRLFPHSRGGVGAKQSGVEINETRLIIFPGIRVSRAQVAVSLWGDSVLTRCWRVLRDFNISWAATTALLHDFSQSAYKIKGLAELIAQDKDDVIQMRIRAVELARSTIRAILMDSEEEFERKQTPVTGLPELLDRLATRLAATADMPVTLLMGQSPAGLNATGESDIRFFYDRVRVVQELGIKPQLERLIYLIMRSIQGPFGGKEPDNWGVEFRPLWQPTEQEIAATRKTIADADTIYFSMGAVSAEEIALSRWGGDTYSPEMMIDFEERARLNATGEKAAEEAPTGVSLLEEIPDELDVETESEEGRVGKEESPADEVEKVEIEEVDEDQDPSTPPIEYVTITVKGHERRIKLRRRDKSQTRLDKIEKRGSKWVVLSRDGNRVLGSYDTREEAVKRLRQIEHFK